MKPQWEAFSREFRLVPDFYHELKAEPSGNPAVWTLAGGPQSVREHFERVARAAGEALAADDEILAAASVEVLREKDSLQRWFATLKLLRIGYRELDLKWESDDGERRAVIPCPALDGLVESSIELCERLAHYEKPQSSRRGKSYKTPFGRNIERYRMECGWSYNDLEEASGIDKKLILGHVNKGKTARPSTLKLYADTFSKQLKRPVTVDDLLAG